MKDLVYLVTCNKAYNGANAECIKNYTAKAVKMILDTFNVPIMHIEDIDIVPEIKKGGKEWTNGKKIFCRADSDSWLCCIVELANVMVEDTFQNSVYYKKHAQPEVALNK